MFEFLPHHEPEIQKSFFINTNRPAYCAPVLKAALINAFCIFQDALPH